MSIYVYINLTISMIPVIYKLKQKAVLGHMAGYSRANCVIVLPLQLLHSGKA